MSREYGSLIFLNEQDPGPPIPFSNFKSLSIEAVSSIANIILFQNDNNHFD